MKQKKLENERKETYSLASNIGFALGGAWRWKKSTLFWMALWMVAQAADAYVPLLVTKFVIDGIERGYSIEKFLIIVAIAALFQFLMYLCNSVSSYQLEPNLYYVMNQFLMARMQKIHTMDFELLESQHMQDMMKRAENGARSMFQLYYQIGRFGFHFFKTLFACVIIFTASPLLILFVVIFSIARYLLADRTKKWTKEHIDNPNISPSRKARYYTSITKDFKYGKDIRLFQMANTLRDRLEKVQTEIYERSTKGRRRKMLADDASMTLDLFIQTGVMYAWMVYHVLRYGMSIGNFTLYLGSIKRFGGALANVLTDIANLRETNRYVNDFRIFMEYPDSVQKETETVKLPEAKQYTFVFDHVWFRYPGHDEYVLKDVSLTIEGGKRLAAVGLNGAGKSTFIKLLCRLYKPTKGRITINGTDIWKVEQQTYFHLLAPVFQNVESYAMTLAQNVSLQTAEDTDKKIAEQCIRKAGLSNKLDSLSDGVDTQLLRFLYEDGIDLSGGEKQKLSLARALYKVAKKESNDDPNQNRPSYPPARVFVLDEPTANLDALAEYAMYSGFDELIGDCTAIYISHRLSSARFCHKIALFESGRITEYGSHDELLEKGGQYAHLYQVQAHYYQEQKEGDQDE